jgi:hypothetical protein
MSDEDEDMAKALRVAKQNGVIVVASAGNEGTGYSITFPATLKGNVFCIGAAEGKGYESRFSPPFIHEEKYSALGEGVRGAKLVGPWPAVTKESDLYMRRDGSSTAAPVAAAIAALLLDYMDQFMKRETPSENYEKIRKLFLFMSFSTIGYSYRNLVPWHLFNDREDSKARIKEVLSRPAGISFVIASLTLQL